MTESGASVRDLLRDQKGREAWAFDHLVPYETRYAVAFDRAGRVRFRVPTARAVAALMHGYIYRDFRQVDAGPNGEPIMEGTGKLLAPMTEEQAVQFIAWKDVPRDVNRVDIILRSAIPVDRTLRNAWTLM